MLQPEPEPEEILRCGFFVKLNISLIATAAHANRRKRQPGLFHEYRAFIVMSERNVSNYSLIHDVYTRLHTSHARTHRTHIHTPHIYAHTHARMHARTHAHTNTHIRILKYTHTRTHTHAHTHARTHTRTHARTHTHTHVYRTNHSAWNLYSSYKIHKGVFTVDSLLWILKVFSKVKYVISLLPLLPKLTVWNLVGLAFIRLILNHCSLEEQYFCKV